VLRPPGDEQFFFLARKPPSGSLPPHSRGFFFYITHDTLQSVGLLWTSDQIVVDRHP